MEAYNQQLIQFLQTENSLFEITEIVRRGNQNNTLDFKIVIKDSSYKSVFNKIPSFLIEYQNSLYIKLGFNDDPFSILPEEKINTLSKGTHPGYIKYFSSQNKTFCLCYQIPFIMINKEIYRTQFLNVVSRLIAQYKEIILKSRSLLAPESSITDESDPYKNQSDDEVCSVCDENLDECACQEKIEHQESDRRVCNKILAFRNCEYFNFDTELGFYDSERNIYVYCPQNLLDNRILEYNASSQFESVVKMFLKGLADSGLFIRKYPNHLIMADVQNSEIVGISMAPAPLEDEKFSRWFSSKLEGEDINDYINRIYSCYVKRFIHGSSNKVSSIEDFIDVSKLKIKEIEKRELFRGKGGFSSVYENELENGTRIAIKVPHLEKNRNLDYNNEQADREYSALKTLNHKNIVKTFGIIEYNGKKCIVLEYIENKLRDLAKNMTEIEKIKIMKGVAEGINKMHSLKYVHQDIKPSNIGIVNGKPKVLDLGFAIEEEIIDSNRGLTLTYADPLQMKGKNPGKPADVWSFALTFFSVLSGKNPYEGVIEENLTRDKDKRNQFIEEVTVNMKRPDFSLISNKDNDMLVNLIKSCLNSDPNKRPTMSSIIETLDHLVQS